MTCKTCGERMEGDGYTRVVHCPNALDTELDYAEPDANPIHCTVDDLLWHEQQNMPHDKDK